MQEITILGCGSSWGVPVIGCKCAVCKSDSPYNKRNRSSILVESRNTKILVDAGFDIRHQLIKFGIDKIDAVIITHDHADHVFGVDDLRIFHDLHNMEVALYTDHKTMHALQQKFSYLFNRDVFKIHEISFYDKVSIGDIDLQFFRQDHGVMDSLGMRVQNIIYTNDVKRYPEETEKYLYDSDTWIVDCVDYKSTATHVGLDTVLEWQKKYKPKNMYLTNMSHDIDYFKIQERLPDNIYPSYDGMKIKVV